MDISWVVCSSTSVQRLTNNKRLGRKNMPLVSEEHELQDGEKQNLNDFYGFLVA